MVLINGLPLNLIHHVQNDIYYQAYNNPLNNVDKVMFYIFLYLEYLVSFAFYGHTAFITSK